MNNELLLDLTSKYGTPLYVYDGNLIVDKFKGVFTNITYPRLHILYAMKANFNPYILKLLEKAGAMIDAVSPSEVLLALRCGFSSERILFTANNISLGEMVEVANCKVTFNIGSLSELKRYGANFPGTSICLRINPGVVAGANANVQTGGPTSKFGILLKDVLTAINISKQFNLHIIGLHEHTGSGIKDTSSFFQSVNNLLEIANPSSFPDLKFIDFGGGFPVAYNSNETNFDFTAFGSTITSVFVNFCKSFGKDLDLYFEPGRYLVAESGVLLIQVNTLKNNDERIIVGTNSGFPQLIRPVLYKGAYHHIVNLSNPNGILNIYDICGNICEQGDYFAKGRQIPEVREGDILAIQTAGAYCYSMGGIYNLRSMPPEIIVYKNSIISARKRITNAELIENILNEYIS